MRRSAPRSAAAPAPPVPSTVSPRGGALASAAVGIAALVVYVVTAAPSLLAGDGGELIVTAARLGVPHPPGYPLHTLLAHLFTLLPAGTLAWRVALLSALCGAGAAALLSHAAIRFTDRLASGVLAGGLFALAPLTWTWSTQAEVFALNDLLLATLLWLAARYARTGAPGDARRAALVAGLALSNHHTALFVVVPLAVWALVRGRATLLAPRRLLALLGLFLLGLLPYAYLPLAAALGDGPAWGDPTTPSGFLAHLLRAEYGTFRLATDDLGEAGLATLLGRYAGHAARALLYVGAPLALAGLAAAFDRRTGGNPARRGLAIAVAVALAGYLLGFHALSNLDPRDPLLASVLARFWLLPDLLLAWSAGLGLAWLVDRWPRARTAALAGAVALVATQGALTLAAAPARDTLVADFGRALLAGLPEGAVLLTRGDLPSNAVRYAQVADGLRPDVVVLDQEQLTFPWAVARAARLYPDLRFPGTHYHPHEPGGFTLAGLVAAGGARPLFVFPEPKEGDPSVAGLALWPEGLAQRVLPRDQAYDREAWDARAAAALGAIGEPLGRAAAGAAPREDPWERLVVAEYWAARHRHALVWVRQAVADPTDTRALEAARAAYEALTAEHPAAPDYAWKNLGMVYERLATRAPAYREKMVAAWRRYLALAPAGDPDRRVVEAAVRRHEATGGVSR